MTNNTLTAIDGLRVGHHTDLENATGCTVVICPPGTIGGVDQRGGAPGTRETDLLRPGHLVQHVNAVVLCGGSAFGLAAANGVMTSLTEQNIGYHTGSGITVPIVPAAVLYDLEIGQSRAFPTAENGHTAAQSATADPVAQGNIGAGTGCVIGKLGGFKTATKGGLGSAKIEFSNGLIVAALFAVNCVGDVYAEDGTILGGVRGQQDGEFVGTLSLMQGAMTPPFTTTNTVIGIVATNARLNKEETNKVAQMAHNGLAMSVRPAHTMYDGDTIFSLATGTVEADVNVVGAFAAEVTATAIRNGIRNSATLSGIRAVE
ncbi:MAG: P1 family peptidase [Chloroflexota bacterium]